MVCMSVTLMSSWAVRRRDRRSISYPPFVLTVKVQRNRSLTRGEIDAFWKEKKSKEEYVGAVNGLVDSNQVAHVSYNHFA